MFSKEGGRKMRKLRSRATCCVLLGLAVGASLAPAAAAQNLTYKPYIELGDAGSFGPSDQVVVAWQTDEASPNPTAYTVEFGLLAYQASVTPSARVVDNYLAADSILPKIPTAPGSRSNYTAVLKNLEYDRTYLYRVRGRECLREDSLRPSTRVSKVIISRSSCRATKDSSRRNQTLIRCGLLTTRRASFT